MITIKVGGSIVDGLHESFVPDLARLTTDGIILVHGGGKDVTKMCSALGVEPRFVTSPSGIRSRYTDKRTAEIFTMVMTGQINQGIVRLLQSSGISALSLAGPDVCILRARRKKRLVIINERGRQQAIEGGYTGTIQSVNSQFLLSMIQQGITPVISPVALGEEFELLNVDGDRAAANVAASTKCDTVIFVTNVDGLFIQDALVESLTLEEARAIRPQVGAGMEKKILAATEALDMGVDRAIICTGRRDNFLHRALAGESCTVITR